MKPHLALLCLLLIGCEKQTASVTEPAPKPLVGDLAEAILPEIGYKRITDKSGASIQGGDEYPDESIGLDASFLRALGGHQVPRSDSRKRRRYLLPLPTHRRTLSRSRVRAPQA